MVHFSSTWWTLHTMYELSECKKGYCLRHLMYMMGTYYNIHKGEGIPFSPVCTFRKVVKNFEVKLNAQKGALRFRETFDSLEM